MLPKKWHHGHSLGAGTIIGISAVSYRGWLLLAIGIGIGIAGTFLILGGYRLAQTLLAGFEAWRDNSRAKSAKIRTRPEPVYTLPNRHARTTDGIPY